MQIRIKGLTSPTCCVGMMAGHPLWNEEPPPPPLCLYWKLKSKSALDRSSLVTTGDSLVVDLFILNVNLSFETNEPSAALYS